MEVWKDIKGYEGLYQVSSFGRVKNINTGRILKQQENHCGYLRIGLRKNDKQKTYRVNRLVAITFLDNPNKLPQVNHIDENKLNNRVENLEWCSNKYNMNYGKGKLTRRINSALGCRKSIEQYDLKGNFIKKYNGVIVAAKELKISSSGISGCLNGKQKTAYRFIWKYAE